MCQRQHSVFLEQRCNSLHDGSSLGPRWILFRPAATHRSRLGCPEVRCRYVPKYPYKDELPGYALSIPVDVKVADAVAEKGDTI